MTGENTPSCTRSKRECIRGPSPRLAVTIPFPLERDRFSPLLVEDSSQRGENLCNSYSKIKE